MQMPIILILGNPSIDDLMVSQKGWQEPRKILVILNPIFEMQLCLLDWKNVAN